MGSHHPEESTLPTAVREGLERLCTQLQETLGEQLESVIAKMDKDIRQQFAHIKRVFLKRNLGNLPSDCLDKYGSRFV